LPSATASVEAPGVQSLNSSAARAGKTLDTTKNAATAKDRENFTQSFCQETGNIQGAKRGKYRTKNTTEHAEYTEKKPGHDSSLTENGSTQCVRSFCTTIPEDLFW
jgi:hypothetical protein